MRVSARSSPSSLKETCRRRSLLRVRESLMSCSFSILYLSLSTLVRSASDSFIIGDDMMILQKYQLRMMLLIGMNSSFTRQPMPPIIANPIAQLVAIFLNSFLSGFSHTRRNIVESSTNFFMSFVYFVIYSFIQLLTNHVYYFNYSNTYLLLDAYICALIALQPMRQTSLLDSFVQRQRKTQNMPKTKSELSDEPGKIENQQRVTQSEQKIKPMVIQEKKQKRVSFQQSQSLQAYKMGNLGEKMQVQSQNTPMKFKRKMNVDSDEQDIRNNKKEMNTENKDQQLRYSFKKMLDADSGGQQIKMSKKRKMDADSDGQQFRSSIKKMEIQSDEQQVKDAKNPLNKSAIKAQDKSLQSAVSLQQQDFTDKTPIWALPQQHLDKDKRKLGDVGYDPTTLFVPQAALKAMTQAKRQYWKIKAQNYDKIVLFKLGKFYELFYEDAAVGNRYLQLKWMGTTMHVGFPQKCLDKYTEQLIIRGYKVAIVQQMETPTQMKARVKHDREQGRRSEGTLQRGVIEVVSRGTYLSAVSQLSYLPNYLIAVVRAKEVYGYALLDISRNLILVGQCMKKDQLKTVLYQTRPVEMLYDSATLPTEIVSMMQLMGTQLTPMVNKDNLWHPFNAQQILTDFPVSIIEDPYICSALAGIFCYLKRCFKFQEVMAGVKLEMYSAAMCRNMVIDSQALQHLQIFDTPLGVKYSLFHRMDHTSTAFGKRLLRKWLTQPLMNKQLIESRLDAVEYLQQYPQVRKQLIATLSKIPDLQRMVNRLYKYSAQSVASRAIYFEDVKTAKLKQFKKFLLCMLETWVAIKPLRQHPQSITSERLKQMFTLRQSQQQSAIYYEDMQCSSGMLCNIETQLLQFQSYLIWEDDKPIPKKGVLISYDTLTQQTQQSKQQLNNYLDRMIKDMKVANVKYVHTKERYEIQIPQAKQSLRPKDMIFTSKRAGYSRYVTKESRKLVAQLQQKEQKLKDQLTHFICFFFQQFKKKQHIWQQYIKILTQLDCLLSMSVYSQQCQGVRPTFPSEGYLITSGRHPCLPSHDLIPNDIDLTGSKVILLTGPNMGGKSTLLRTTCLLTILAQMGTYVPAVKYECLLVDRVFTRIGASDKLQESKSTFFIEMEETKSMVQYATCRSLLILDELGRGTSTFDGMAIAHAVLEYFIQHSQCRCLFATHYHSLTQEFAHYPTVTLALMDYLLKQDKLIFLYKLTKGCAKQSFAINVAHSVNINQSIISKAQEIGGIMEKEIMVRNQSRIFQKVLGMFK